MAEFIRTQIPIFLPDDTQVGVALIEGNGDHASIRLKTNNVINQLLENQLIGISLVYLEGPPDVESIPPKSD